MGFRILLFLFIFFGYSLAFGASPTERVKEVTDRIIAILSDNSLKSPEKKEEKVKLIKDEINKVFDWEEFSKRSLAQHWQKLTPQQKDEFIKNYQKLLESVYSDRMNEYSGEQVRYEGEEISGQNSIVKVAVLGYKGVDVPLIYRLVQKNNQWFVYDVVIEGVSLVNNYRSQFNSIMIKSGYDGLLKAIKDKIEGKGDTIK
ncbi:MAG: phospholipid-binding protein MlaC [Desulfatiglandales bacterium]